MSAAGVISILPYKIKEDEKNELYRNYMARCARLCTENLAKLSRGNYIRVEFDELFADKPREDRPAREIIDEIFKGAGIEVINT
jgi:hypothetical protein